MDFNGRLLRLVGNPGSLTTQAALIFELNGIDDFQHWPVTILADVTGLPAVLTDQETAAMADGTADLAVSVPGRLLTDITVAF